MAFTTEAYAVFDSADGSLKFFRDEPGKYTNGQIIDTKTYYTGIETRSEESTANAPWYSNRASVQSVTFEDIIQPVSTANWFFSMKNTNFTSIVGLDKLDTSKVTSMAGMFIDCRNLTSLDVSHFDTSNVMYMHDMFDYCQNLTSLDVSHFDTSNVISMGNMFSYCQNLTSLDVSHFDTSNVSVMTGMFEGCSNLTTLDVSHFDTSSLTRMGRMFFSCHNLTTTLNIMNMPSVYSNMCSDAARDSGQLTLKYISPVTSADIDTLVATKSSGNVINGGEGTFVPPMPPGDIYKYLPMTLYPRTFSKIKSYIDSTIDAKIAELLQTLNQ